MVLETKLKEALGWQNKLKEVFRAATEHKDGLMCRLELKTVFNNLGLRENFLEDILAHADVNGDGKVSSDQFVDWVMAHEDPLADVSDPEARLLELHQASKGFSTFKGGATLSQELASLFIALSDQAVPRARAALDADSVFRPLTGKQVDLRHLVYEELDPAEREVVLQRISSSCTAPPSDLKGFVVVSDEQVLLSGKDLRSGCVPGIGQLHSVLRGELDALRGYSVLLTSQPASHCAPLAQKCFQPQLHESLPESSEPASLCAPRVAILSANDCEAKLARMLEYAALFPDYAGRFVFLAPGSDASVELCNKMLAMTLPGNSQPVFAFGAVLAETNTCKDTRKGVESRFRKQHSVGHCLGAGNGRQSQRNRFFYYLSVNDLTRQLAEDGWLTQEQRYAVLQAVADES